MMQRIIRAIRLDPTVYREVADDRNAMKEAAIIVLVVTLLSGLGAAGGALIAKAGVGQAAIRFLVDWLVNGILIGWIGWAVITYLVGTALFKGKTDVSEMMRVLGYASAPKLLGFFGFIPCVGWLIALVGWVLSLIAGFIAVREAMGFETLHAIVTVVIGWIIALALALIIGSILGIGGAAVGGLLG
jgi:hypothetical protein